MSQPIPQLDGITVLNLASVGPAARAARTLADLGARIIQVSPTARKGAKQISPPFHSYGAGRGIERMQIDLKAPEGKQAFLKIAASADVVMESYRPGVVARLGIGFDDVRAVSPRIVYCSTTGYGQDGPASDWAGHDLNYLGVAGYLACSEPRSDGGPPIPWATVADSAGGGMHAVVSILAALVRRSMGGEAQFLDVAAAEGVLSLMSLSIDQYLASGEVAGPRQVLLTGRYAFYDVYPCRDGKWVTVGAIEPHFYRNLCGLLGLDQFAEFQMDDSRQEEIRQAFRDAFLTRDRDDWVAELAPKNTCVGPVYEIPELVDDPHFVERNVFMQAEHAEQGPFRQVGPVLAGGLRKQPDWKVRPADASDAEAILEGVGFDADEINNLRQTGAVQ